MPGKKFRVALIQMDSGSRWEENKKRAEEFLRDASAQGADYVQFPETVDYIGDDSASYAREYRGEAERFFSEMAEKYGVYLHCGSITEYQKQERPKNSTLFYSPKGELLEKYSKLHLFDVDVEDGPSCRESDEIQPGDRTAVAVAGLGTFGLSICYDLRFPELYRKLATDGAWILCCSANFTRTTGECHWKTLLRARAIENTCFVLAADQCGKKPKFQAYGHSMAIDPWGEILTELGEEPGMGIADIDFERLCQVRRELPCLANRRRGMFGESMHSPRFSSSSFPLHQNF